MLVTERSAHLQGYSSLENEFFRYLGPADFSTNVIVSNTCFGLYYAVRTSSSTVIIMCLHIVYYDSDIKYP